MRAFILFILVLIALGVTADTRAECPLAHYCCDAAGRVLCAANPPMPSGLVCMCGASQQGKAC
jgi:hypothetical protein